MIRLIVFLVALTLYGNPVFGQTNAYPRNYPAATLPLVSGTSCFWIMNGGGAGSDRTLCSGWAAGIGALSTTLDTQSNESPFSIPQTDAFKIVYRTNRTPQADTIAGFYPEFGVTYFSGPQGNSVNPQGGITFNGRAGYSFGAKQGAVMFFDGANYQALVGLPIASSQDSTQVLSNDNIYRQIGPAQLAPGAVTTPALASGLNLSSPTFTFGSDAPGDLYVRGGNGLLTRLPVGAANAVLASTAGTCTTNSLGVVICPPNMPAYQTTLSPNVLPIATNSSNGVGRPDGSVLTVDSGGTWHSTAGDDQVTNGIIALGTSQATCAALTTQASYITTVTAGSGVCMPGLVQGRHYFICNKTTTPVLVYAPPGGSVLSTPSGPLAPTGAISVGRGCPEFIAESTSSLWVTGAGVPLVVQ